MCRWSYTYAISDNCHFRNTQLCSVSRLLSCISLPTTLLTLNTVVWASTLPAMMLGLCNYLAIAIRCCILYYPRQLSLSDQIIVPPRNVFHSRASMSPAITWMRSGSQGNCTIYGIFGKTLSFTVFLNSGTLTHVKSWCLSDVLYYYLKYLRAFE